jgi:phage-related protein
MAEETVLIRFKSEDDATKTTKAVNYGLDDVGKKADNAGKSFSGMGTMMTGVLQGIGQGIVGLAADLGKAAVGAVTDFIGGAIEEASAWNSVYAQTEAVIKSTGSAAGLTAAEMANMAGAMSAASGQSLFSDDAILGAQNVLATFTNIKGENFGSATQSILDMSQALGMDLDSAAMQVGKALNDPVAGLAALSRSGVQFTADQEAMIKAMVEAGNVAGAQEVMMAELNTQFGGSAAAAVDTYAGQQVVLSEKMADVQQGLGEALMPILMEFGTFMSDTVVPIIASVVTSLSGWITSMQETGTTSGVFDTIRNAIAGIPGVLATLNTALDTVLVFLQPLTDAATTFGTIFLTAMTSAGTAIMEYLASPMVMSFLEGLQSILGALATLVRDVLVLAFQGAAIAWDLLSQAFTIAWPYIQTVLDTFLSLVTIVMSTVTGILEVLSKLVTGDFQGAWTTLKTTLDTTIKDITGFFTTLETNVKNVLNELMGKFKEVGTNIATGIANGISDAAGKIATAARNAASDAYEAAKKFLGMASPSKLMRDQVGMNFSKGMALGILDGIPEVASAARDTAAVGAATAAQTVNNITLTANYSNAQSESSLIADARAWMMTMGRV